MDTNVSIQEAVQKAESGDLQSAQTILASVLRQEPRNVRAWYLLSQVVGDRNREIDCLQKVLEIEPNSQQAKAGLQKLQQLNLPVQPQPAIPPVQPIPKNKTSSVLWILLILGLGIAAFCLVVGSYIYSSTQNLPDATQCARLEDNYCDVGGGLGDTHIIGFIVNTCDKPITNVSLKGEVISVLDNSVLAEISGEIADSKTGQAITSGQHALFDLIKPNSYYGPSSFLRCDVSVQGAYFVK
jgi:hypothetical protein